MKFAPVMMLMLFSILFCGRGHGQCANGGVKADGGPCVKIGDNTMKVDGTTITAPTTLKLNNVVHTFTGTKAGANGQNYAALIKDKKGVVQAWPAMTISSKKPSAAAYRGYSNFNGYYNDYGINEYDEDMLYEEAWENLQAAQEQFEIAQRLKMRGQRTQRNPGFGQRGQRLMRYGGY